MPAERKGDRFMLSVLESRLLEALKSDLPATAGIAAGPVHGPPAGEEAFLSVHVAGLKLLTPPTESEEEKPERNPASLTRVERWEKAGQQADQQDFLFAGTGEVIEVESPPGRPRNRGDHYEVSGGGIRFYRAPGETVVATIREGPALGYQEKRPCEIELNSIVWAQNMAEADRLLNLSQVTVLTAVENIGILSGPANANPGVSMRLLSATTQLSGMERGIEKIGAVDYFRFVTSFRIKGELEITVALGEAEPQERIGEIIYDFGG